MENMELSSLFEMEKIDYCDLCSSKQFSDLYVIPYEDGEIKFNAHLVKCSGCGLVFLNPRPKREEMWKFYKGYSLHDELRKRKEYQISWRRQTQLRLYEYCFNAHYQGGLRKIIALLLALVLRNRVDFGIPVIRQPKGKILDVGCADGMFVDIAARNGWDAYGCETEQSAVKKAQSLGLNVQAGDVTEQKYPSNYFDVVRSRAVIYHVHQPRQNLEEIHRILKPSGELILIDGDMNSFYSRFFKEKWAGLDVPIHLYLLNRSNYKRYLEETGFEIKQIRYISLGTGFRSFKLRYNIFWGITFFFINNMLDLFWQGDAIKINAIAKK